MADISFTSRLRNAWDVFRNRDPTQTSMWNETSSAVGNPGIRKLSYGVDRTLVASLYNRIAMDVASIDIWHVRTDENGRYKELIDDELNKRLTLSANIDQTGRSFIQDVALTLFDEGAVAIVPVETSVNPLYTESYDILQLRTGKILEWFANHVRVQVYNQRKGELQEIVMPKTRVAIVQNPLYAVMNERSSLLSRLTRKLALLDGVDERVNSGKLDLLIQLPYEAKSERKKSLVDERLKDIENQIMLSKYGIAYLSGTERVVQLNRPAENNLLEQIKYNMEQMYTQLGVTEPVYNGTADEAATLNYYNRTVEPVVSEICDAMTRTFVSKTARAQRQKVMYFRDPFKLVPVSQIAEIADKFTRNEILSSNELRAILGYKPVDDPRADELRNKNLNAQNDQLPGIIPGEEEVQEDVYDDGGEEEFFREELY